MMAWNAYVLLAGIVGGILLGMYSSKITWRTSLVALAGVIVLGWAAGRYGVEAADDVDRAFIVDSWTERRVGLLFDVGRDAPENDLADRR
jgi:hypothetical protein